MRGPGDRRDRDTQTQTPGQRTSDGVGTDGEGSVRGTCGREGSLGTPRTPIPYSSAKGLILPGDRRSPTLHPALRTGRPCSSRFWVSLGWPRARQRVQAW